VTTTTADATTTRAAERGIIMQAESVRAILAGTKSQTRRLLKPQPEPRGAGDYFDAYCSEPKTTVNPRGMSNEWCWWTADPRPAPSTMIRCLYGQPGDRLWVKESWQTGVSLDKLTPSEIGDRSVDAGYSQPWAPIRFPADGVEQNADTLRDFGGAWGKARNPLFVPRWASRLTLEVTEVRVERLQAISENDAIAEGCNRNDAAIVFQAGARGFDQALSWTARGAYAVRWDEINKRAPWSSNPWLWAITFRRIP
jgi:hypothetical protein